MKRIKSILFALSILLACFLLSACGGKLETNLNLNSEFKGSRVMTLRVRKVFLRSSRLNQVRTIRM